MAIDPEIQAAVNAIDRKIAKLQQVKDLLLSEFSSNGAVTTGSLMAKSTPSASQIPGRTRKDQIIGFLFEKGPTSRREIVEIMAIPAGTVSYVLNDEEFRHLEKSGKWDITKELREQIEKERAGQTTSDLGAQS